MTTYGTVPYNIDINQPGASQYPRFSISQPTPYQDALVEDVILNEAHPDYLPDGSNIGMIRVRFIPDDRSVPKEKLNWASPLDTSIREYPLKSELVLVFYSLGRLFYTRRINVTNKVTESSWPGLREGFSPKLSGQEKSNSALLAAAGGTPYRPWGKKQKFSLGDEFSENPDVRMIRPNEGDLVIQGRFGNTVRFGSSLFSNPSTATPQPNILFSVGQSTNREMSTQKKGAFSLVYEDINKDKSSIWMVTNERIVLNPATIDSVSHLRSTEISDSTKYTGAQIFFNSDRLIFNSKQNEISLFAKKEINLSAAESITIDSAKSVMITGEKDITITTPADIVLTGKTISLNSPNDISIGTSGNYTIDGRKIFIGSGGDESQPMVLGGELTNWLQTLVSALALLSVTFIPSPTGAASAAQLARYLTELKGNLGVPGIPQSAVFNSTSNFTSKTN